METKAGGVLIVTYYFPPMSAAGSHRVMNFSRELHRLGWDVDVVSSADFKRNAVDEGLMERLGPGVKVRRAASTDVVELLARMKRRLKPAGGGTGEAPSGGNGHEAREGLFDYLSRFLKTPDSMVSFIPSAVWRALPVMMSRRPDVILSSAPPYSCHLAALLLKSLFSVPWIADFRDPWAGNPFREEMPYRSLHALNRMWEERVVKSADLVVTNTRALEEQFRQRYPQLDRFVTMTNGFDPELPGKIVPSAGPSGGPIRLVHTGEVYGLRSPRSMIEALGEMEPNLREKLKIEFFGNVDERAELEEQALGLGVNDRVLYGGQVRHDEALKRCAEADLLLLLGVMGKRPEVQVPSKVFEYLAMKKPIVSLSKRGGAIHGILEDSGVPYLLADLESAPEIEVVLSRAVRGDFDGGGDWSRTDAFAFDRLAMRLASMLTDLKQGLSPMDPKCAT
jgi:glycosyltransferase involved in cell wall biosynthesis